MSRLLTMALAFVVASRAVPAAAESPPDPTGGEFVDMPEQPAASTEPATAETAAPPSVGPTIDNKARPAYLPGYRRLPALGLSPHAPQFQPAMPGALTPSFGAPVASRDWRLSFTGYLQAAARASVGSRDSAGAGQHRLTLHGDPVVPGSAYGWFDHSGTVPDPWAQLNFVYGNDRVTATASVGAWSVSESDQASGSFMANAQLWFVDAFLTYTPELAPVRLKVNVGVFPDRYGFMGNNTQGAYGEVLIGEVRGVGTTVTLGLPFEGDVTVTAEAGVKGELGKAPLGIVADGSNEYARPEEGSTFAAHAHLGVGFRDTATLTGHLVHAWSQDDRKDAADRMPDGSLSTKGLDLRVAAGRFGYLYLGGARSDGDNASAISDLVKILNAGSGKELNERYWGFAANGTGRLNLLGAQYTVSLGTLLRYPMEFWGEGPDLSISVFGIYGRAERERETPAERKMLKVGAEGVYSFSEWVVAALRLDEVRPDLDVAGRAYAIVTPKLIFRSGWLTRESLTVQYSYYDLGSDVRVEGDRRLVSTSSATADRHLVAVYGTLWW